MLSRHSRKKGCVRIRSFFSQATTAARRARYSPPVPDRRRTARRAAAWAWARNRRRQTGDFARGKGSLYEGGVRVPAFVNWPGKLKPAVVAEPIAHGGYHAHAAGFSRREREPTDHPFDGKNIWPVLCRGRPSPHEEILINVEAIRGAIRKGDWKLVRMATFPGKTELYNLAQDPEEKNNVADRNIPRSFVSWMRGWSPTHVR